MTASAPFSSTIILARERQFGFTGLGLGFVRAHNKYKQWPIWEEIADRQPLNEINHVIFLDLIDLLRWSPGFPGNGAAASFQHWFCFSIAMDGLQVFVWCHCGGVQTPGNKKKKGLHNARKRYNPSSRDLDCYHELGLTKNICRTWWSPVDTIQWTSYVNNYQY